MLTMQAGVCAISSAILTCAKAVASNAPSVNTREYNMGKTIRNLYRRIFLTTADRASALLKEVLQHYHGGNNANRFAMWNQTGGRCRFMGRNVGFALRAES